MSTISRFTQLRLSSPSQRVFDLQPLRKAIARVDWVVQMARNLREKEHKHLATSIAQGPTPENHEKCWALAQQLAL